MSGRTKLYQQTGSPLIGGDSKIVRPFWSVWLGGVLVGYVIAVAVTIAIQWFVVADGETLGFSEVAVTAAFWVAVMGLPGLLIGGAFGAWLARKMGWYRTSLASGIVGSVLALITIYVFLFVLDFSLTAPV